MQITLSQILKISASPIFGMRLPSAVSYTFAKLAKLIEGELKTYEAERRKLIEECNGVLSEDKKQFTFELEDTKAFGTGMDALLAVTVDIGVHFPMAIEALGEKTELSPVEFVQLEPLFDIGEGK